MSELDAPDGAVGSAVAPGPRHRRRPRRPFVLVAAVLAAAALGWVLTRWLGGESAVVVRPPTEQLRLDGPSDITAGDPWPLRIEGVGQAGGSVTVDIWGPWGVREIVAPVGAAGAIEVPGDLTTQTGVLSASVVSGSGIGRATVEVLPGPAVDGIVPLAGPRSMVADAAHWTMVSAFPVDRYGNAMSDGTEVQLVVRRPSGDVQVIDTTIQHLVAGVRVFSGVRAGRSTIRIDVGGATGPEVEVLEVPGPPVAVELLEPDLTLRADGRMLVTVATAPLADAFGNELLDGTAASIEVEGPSGTGAATAVTIDGRAEFVIEAPPSPGTVRLRAVVDGVRSGPIELEFVNAVGDLPVTAERFDSDGGSLVRVEVGPVTTDLGGFVPDGTRVSVVGAAEPAGADLRDGVATLTVAAAPGDDLIVEVLGVSVGLVTP